MLPLGADGVRVHVFERGAELSLALADRVAQLAASRVEAGRALVLGLGCGATLRSSYRALQLRRRTGQLGLRRAAAFGIGEYCPLSPRHGQSVTRELTREALELGVDRSRLFFPRGDLARGRIERHCVEYEEAIRRAGGIDLQLVGIGRTGQVGFNEPGASPTSRTRQVLLSELTRHDTAGRFGGIEHTPYKAVTMGLGTIGEAREIVLVAIGIHKAAIIKRVLEGPISPEVPASHLRQHPGVMFCLDRAAASLLTSRVTPPDAVEQLGVAQGLRIG